MKREIPKKYLPLWTKVSPILKKARPGDYEHALEVVDLILNYKGKIKIDFDILIPVAMMHDIGHAAILPEHFKYITGPEKLINGKLTHMLVGAKIAMDILEKIKYPKIKILEITDIIGSHDADQLQGVSLQKWYNTESKKIFHDLDSMDRYTEERLKSAAHMYPDRKVLMGLLEKSLESFFYDEFKNIARKRYENL